jgi:Na+-transporting NADH:ubiquinone oxidoreductase subunit B
MGFLRTRLDRMAPHFEPGGRFAALHPVFELVDTLLYTPASVTRTASHVRDGLDLKRMMMTVVVALVPCILMAMYNTGYQAHLAIDAGGGPLNTYQTTLMQSLGLAFDPRSGLACFVHGALYFLPVLLVTFAVGGLVEVGSAMLRKHQVNEGFFVTGFLLPLTLPPTIPLWQVALGIGFGVLFGKEVFGGTGMNFLNPALLARAFLFFAYPADISGNVWTAASWPELDEQALEAITSATLAGQVDAVTGATLLTQLNSGMSAISYANWWDAFIGTIPGSMGETSTLACLIGALILLVTRIASFRIMFGVVAGTFVMALVLDAFGSADNAMLHIPFHFHIVLGGWAFATVFMATDPVTAPFTDRARWIYGVLIGALIVLIRAVNPAYPEGAMLAILLMNVFSSLLDHFVVRANIRRRAALYAR